MSFLALHFADTASAIEKVPKDKFHAPISYLDRLFSERLYLSPAMSSCSDITTDFFDKLFTNLRHFVQITDKVDKDWPILVPLKGWREEKYGVYVDPLSPGFSTGANNGSHSTLLFQVERSAVSLLGVVGYGVHANGAVLPASSMDSEATASRDGVFDIAKFIRSQDKKSKQWRMWIARRSDTKFTYPGMLDQLSAGGLSINYSPHSTLVKECWEEAGLDPDYTMTHAVPAGTISYCQTSHGGVTPKIQFIYDLFLPEDFVPKAMDGEVCEFYLWTIEEILSRIKNGEFKPNSAMTIIHFCVRHGIIRPDNERDYHRIMAAMHAPLPFSWM
jgi:8-oxo-dGTP pyrophosphatase MutT (NUDIX family)